MSIHPLAETSPESEVIVRRVGQLGHLVLNRPKALNSLTRGMVDTVRAALDQWSRDDEVRTVLVSGAGEKGLCAGGDVVSIHHSAVHGRHEVGDAFFAAEYAMNAAIAHYPKPYVAFMDGIVLGGGVGISSHGSHRIVTERTRLGMPETGIGFFPDVGAAWLLSRAPAGFGMHLALTAEFITGADALALGLADYFIPSERLADLARTLETTEAQEAIEAIATPSPVSALKEHRRWIQSCYEAETAEGIVEALQADSDLAANRAAAEILAKSPTSVKVTVELLRRVRNLTTLDETLQVDAWVAHHMLRGHDMREGIRAQLVDKDRNPQWNPSVLEDVRDADVDAHFPSSTRPEPRTVPLHQPRST